MKIYFKIQYFTNWGQSLLICGNIAELGNSDLLKAIPMNYESNGDWTASIELDFSIVSRFKYRYVLYNEPDNQYIEECDNDRRVSIDSTKIENLYCFDNWNSPASLENVFLTTPFQNVLLKNRFISTIQVQSINYSHEFRVKAPLIEPNQVVCILGDCEELGSWSTKLPVKLTKSEEGFWVSKLNISDKNKEIHYKYGLFCLKENKFLHFEAGDNRIAPNENKKDTVIQLTDSFARFTNLSWKGAGVSIPVFSLRTKNSLGVGDFDDLKLFVDWSAKVGLKLIQVLPLNDTIGTHTDADVLPYAAISAFALNPLFLNLLAIGKLPPKHPLQLEFNSNKNKWNNLEIIEYLEIVNFKLLYARELFTVKKTDFINNERFKSFFKENEHWLVPYSIYCVLRDKFETPDFTKWNEYTVFDKINFFNFLNPDNPHYDDINFNFFVQYHLHIQLLNAAEYAHIHGVVLKGDIPICVNKFSVDTWVSPELFHMDMQAGAPPDMFSVKGQNWELPTYNWKKMQETNFDWWKNRFAQMSNYFDAFRIDHILGFFRIWQIPAHHVEGIMGYLNPSNPIHISEFGIKGLWFDYNRFCKPYITDSLLWVLFAEEASWVKANYLQIEDGWILRLKPEYQSQKIFENLYQESKISERVRNGMFDIISNVLFIEVEGSKGTQFYPRFGMENLESFAELDSYTKDRLKELYVDYFYRRQDYTWYDSGMEKLPALKRATNMMIFGEDLGMMTPCVTSAMKELGILSLEVQRSPKSNKKEFFHPNDAPYLSVVTPSTHDMSTIRGWWEEDRDVSQRFYNSQLGHWGEAPYFCEWWICRDIILQHLYSPAMWSIFQIQDLLSISELVRRKNPHDERINVPSNSKSSWRYRLHINIEDLLNEDYFNDELRNYIIQSGR